MEKRCGICGSKRDVNFHHYYPRPYRNKRNRKDGIYICRERHNWLHHTYSNKEIADYFSSYDELYSLIRGD